MPSMIAHNWGCSPGQNINNKKSTAQTQDQYDSIRLKQKALALRQDLVDGRSIGMLEIIVNQINILKNNDEISKKLGSLKKEIKELAEKAKLINKKF